MDKFRLCKDCPFLSYDIENDGFCNLGYEIKMEFGIVNGNSRNFCYCDNCKLKKIVTKWGTVFILSNEYLKNA